MATSSNNTPDTAPAAETESAATQATPSKARKTTTSRKTTSPRKATTSRSTATSAAPKPPVAQVTDLANRALLVQVGAGLQVRDDVVSTVRDLATKYGTRSGLERELKRYEKRGAAARNRFEKQVRRVRRDFDKQSKVVTGQVEKIVSSAHGFIS
jgi:electron transfer flavoprotein alpha subunit